MNKIEIVQLFKVNLENEAKDSLCKSNGVIPPVWVNLMCWSWFSSVCIQLVGTGLIHST